MEIFNKLKIYLNKINTIEGELSTNRDRLYEVYERNLQLEKEISLRTKELAQANKTLLSLQNVWEMMNASQPISIIFDKIISNLQDGLDYQMCFLLQKKKVDDEEFYQIKAYLNNQDIQDWNSKLDFPINHYKLNYDKNNELGITLSSNCIQSFSNIREITNELFSSIEEDVYDKYEIFSKTKSLIVLPLYSNAEAFGIILVFSPRDDVSSSERTFLNLFDSQTELAITIANLFEEVKKQAVTDPLTELYNRRYFLETLDKEAERANRTGVPFSIISLDLDNLKKINDAYGHSIGDVAIKTVAKVLKRNARAIDTPSRLGGEEFSVLLPDVDSKSAMVVAERIRESIEKEEVELLGHVTASVGVATYFEHSSNLEELMEMADQAMYRSKINGRNQVQMAKSKEDSSWQEIAIEAFMEILSKRSIPVPPDTAQKICSQLSQKMVSESTARDLVFQTADTIATIYTNMNCTGSTKLKVALAVKLAKKMELSDAEIDKLKVAVLLYDIGKALIPPELMNKKEPLTEEEKNILRNHPMVGVQEILKPISVVSDILPIVENHHENWDGSGYPQKISGENIPVLSQIILLVDSYCALIQNRPYRAALSQEEAIDVINNEIGKKWNSKLVYDFIQVLCIENAIEDNILNY